MDTLIKWALFAVIALYIAFVVAMRFKTRREQRGYLHLREKLIAYPVLIVGYPLDVVVNLTVASLLFLDPPAELTVSSRLERYIIDGDDDWRRAMALWIDRKLIQPVDEDHLG